MKTFSKAVLAGALVLGVAGVAMADGLHVTNTSGEYSTVSVGGTCIPSSMWSHLAQNGGWTGPDHQTSDTSWGSVRLICGSSTCDANVYVEKTQDTANPCSASYLVGTAHLDTNSGSINIDNQPANSPVTMTSSVSGGTTNLNILAK